ncbi:MAG: hypothetical protein LC663_01585, partial [Actinobacteria bacterium]|nr:hypothetical protein [Actinomycetota bacterium]
ARARAQSAADAAALAAATAQVPAFSDGTTMPEDVARAEAERNGGRLDRCDCSMGGARATVDVSVDAHPVFIRAWFGARARATASASVDPDVLTYRAGG